ncbi:hypothetical protein [Cerasicoccus frondis]|uniref:hypothetical protein n=1 Tax=Cerasicoccus frondis TaxID=490090 RepID=UPI0028525BFA|nr:hypothetical protein [Cerasicoccus frondis]
MPINQALPKLAILGLAITCASPTFALYNNGYLIACPSQAELANSWLGDVLPALSLEAPKAPAKSEPQRQVGIDAYSGEIKFPSLSPTTDFEAQGAVFDVPETDFSRYGKAFAED